MDRHLSTNITDHSCLIILTGYPYKSEDLCSKQSERPRRHIIDCHKAYNCLYNFSLLRHNFQGSDQKFYNYVQKNVTLLIAYKFHIRKWMFLCTGLAIPNPKKKWVTAFNIPLLLRPKGDPDEIAKGGLLFVLLRRKQYVSATGMQVQFGWKQVPLMGNPSRVALVKVDEGRAHYRARKNNESNKFPVTRFSLSDHYEILIIHCGARCANRTCCRRKIR